jgi:hypothetical protein
MKLKRGIFRGKKAQTEHESMWTLSEMVFFSIFVITLLLFSYTVWKNTTFQKNFLARDMAMTLDTLYMSPQKLTYSYPNNVSDYNFIYAGNLVRVGEADSLNTQTDRMYWFADDYHRQLNYMAERINRPDTVLYIASPYYLVMLSDNGNLPVEPPEQEIEAGEEE